MKAIVRGLLAASCLAVASISATPSGFAVVEPREISTRQVWNLDSYHDTLPSCESAGYLGRERDWWISHYCEFNAGRAQWALWVLLE